MVELGNIKADMLFIYFVAQVNPDIRATPMMSFFLCLLIHVLNSELVEWTKSDQLLWNWKPRPVNLRVNHQRLD